MPTPAAIANVVSAVTFLLFDVVFSSFLVSKTSGFLTSWVTFGTSTFLGATDLTTLPWHIYKKKVSEV